MPTVRSLVRPVVALALVVVALACLGAPASAHSLDSTTISIRTDGTSVDATITLSVATLDEAMGTDLAGSEVLDDGQAAAIFAYLDDHLAVTGADGAGWEEIYEEVVRESIEGIDSLAVDVAFDADGGSVEGFTIAYDAVVEAVAGHRAVVVFTDAEGSVSTPGIITASGDTVAVGESAPEVAVTDMVGHGFHHVLEGADHLLFLAVLLLPAPLVVVAGRWRRRDRLAPTVRQVVHVITAFTVGHSLTLVASSLGWISLPSQPVEVLVAASVAVSAIHLLRPFAVRGEAWIALAFGLVHGLAFAGILADLGLAGTTSLVALGGFNVGVELAQLATAAVVFPPLLLLSTTRRYDAVRVTGATFALALAGCWILERLELVANPLAPLEEAAVGHPWWVAALLAVLSLATWAWDRRAAETALQDGSLAL